MTTWVAVDLGLLPGGNFSIALAANSDGSVIVGVADTGDFNGHAFRWTSGGGMQDLGLLAGGSSSIAYGVSADGSIVVGQSDGGGSALGNTEAFRWTSGGGMVGLGFLGTGTASLANGISADGTTIVGYSTNVPGVIFGTAFPEPCKWVSGVPTALGSLAGNPPSDLAQAASSDGSVIVGGNSGGGAPWYWTAGGGTVAMPLAVTQTAGNGLAVSANGLIAAGQSLPPGGAFLATLASTAVLIGNPPGDSFSIGYGLSGDGTIIVGGSGAASIAEHAFLWTNAGGFESLPPLVGGSQANAHGISSNGLVPVGSSGPGGSQHAVYWVPVGAPTSVTLADMWFSNTGTFIDLTDTTNRRKFISDTGGAQNLGPDGSTPFSVAPVVFLTRTTTPDTFALNKGRGGPFIITGGTLAAGASDPPGTSVSVTTGGTFSAGNGVLGDYRNGNLYAFNPATYLDNGTQRKWVRRWRALPGSTVQSIRYSYLTVDMQTGAGVPPMPLYALNPPSGGFSFSGGSGYSVNDIIALHLNDGIQLFRAVLGVTSVSASGAVTGWNMNTVGSYSARPTGFTQASSSGAGTGFTLTITNPDQAYSEVGPPDPQLMLRWSDDGGHTWSNYRLKPAGRTGQTSFTVKFNRLGSSSRFSGADRIFELSSTDPFQVAIVDAEVDSS